VRIAAKPERGYLVVCVQDNGDGIEPRDHEKVFERFRQHQVLIAKMKEKTHDN
jgi:signal transduction histidine kinase